MSVEIKLSAQVPVSMAGQRLDQIAGELFPEYSRSRLQGWIREGALCVDQRKLKPNARLAGGERLTLDGQIEDSEQFEPEDLPLNVIYEDAQLIVLNKPAGLVVHPAAGNWTGTLLNGILHHYPDSAAVPRAGIVHRLDKDTSGLMVVARTVQAQAALVEQLSSRSVSRTYWALVQGTLEEAGEVDAPIGRHPQVRTKMAVVQGGRDARTHYRPLRHFDGVTLVELKLETGRTHQIRVHMAYQGFPLIGDPVYGRALTPVLKKSLPASVVQFERQALHAKALGLMHPESGEALRWKVPVAEDMQHMLDDLEEAQGA